MEPIHPGLPGTVPVSWGVERSVPVSHRICFGTLDPSYCDSINCINVFPSSFSSESVPTINLPNVKMKCVVTVVSVCDNPDSVVQEQC